VVEQEQVSKQVVVLAHKQEEVLELERKLVAEALLRVWGQVRKPAAAVLQLVWELAYKPVMALELVNNFQEELALQGEVLQLVSVSNSLEGLAEEGFLQAEVCTALFFGCFWVCIQGHNVFHQIDQYRDYSLVKSC
jgi:hypothetical protein